MHRLGVPMAEAGTIRGIPELVAPRWGVTVGELLSQRRDVRVARPRQVAMWLALRVVMSSRVEIGRYFGRDPATVAHAVRRIDGLMRTDAALAAAVWNVARRVDAEQAASLCQTMLRRVA